VYRRGEAEVISGGSEMRGERFGGMVRVEGKKLPEGSEVDGREVREFEMGRYAVRWKEWKEVVEWSKGKGYDLEGLGAGRGEEHPVTLVSWYDVVKWCNAMSDKEGREPVYEVYGDVWRTMMPRNVEDVKMRDGANGYRLPFESEWDWAARGGMSSKGYTYSGSNVVEEVAWYKENSGGYTKAVGLLGSNELGIHDMSGNVWEWCWDAMWKKSSETDRRICGGGEFSRASDCAVVGTPDAPILRRAAKTGVGTPALGFRVALSSVR
jgi:sulfatase modifying factor 1